MNHKRVRSVKKKCPVGIFLAELCADGYCGKCHGRQAVRMH
ncbi:MAG: hypothetical protein IJB70_01870, partial [Clostridia bacterium]|nr:hypothetical protein [Clostridia bacterium]